MEKSVLLVDQFFPPDQATTAKLLETLAIALKNRNLKVKVLTGKPAYAVVRNREPEKCNGVLVEKVFSTNFPRTSHVRRLINQISFCVFAVPRILFTKEKRIILFSDPFLLPYAGPILKIFGKKYYFFMFDLYPDAISAYGIIKKNGTVFKIIDWLERCTINSSEKTFVIGNEVKEKLVKEKKIRAAKVEVLGAWSNIGIPQMKNKKIKRLFGTDLRGKIALMHAGNIGPAVDLNTLISVAESLKKNKRIVFFVVGDGRKKKELEKAVKSKKLKNVKIAPYQKPENLLGVLNAADIQLVLFHKSFNGIGVPSKTYSAMALGKPIIAVAENDTATAKAVKSADAGIVIQSGQIQEFVKAIKTVSKNKKVLGANAKKFIEKKHTADMAARKLEKILFP